MTAALADRGAVVMHLEGVGKDFGAITALRELSLDVRAGEVTAIVGDNGAGKSTLMKIIAGVHQPSRGQIVLNGEEIRMTDPSIARNHGIEVVYQDLALADQQTVYMNMFLGRELTRGPFRRLDRKRMARESKELIEELDVRIPSVNARVSDLSGGQRQGVAIGRAAHWATQLVLMDEPTAALGVQETKRTEELILRMREGGRAIMVVSHSLDQVFRISDRICVLRRGEQAGVLDTAETTGDEVVAMITGLRSGSGFEVDH
ncbi:MAG: simple sugar transport system ATP-binding protein [Solirubrobacterales bacterium]|jgi:simple sugar transport system ATP-binding protein|nr:simple sugar transport system ATP-binding protein [Solirubrobacterales bacterium]